MTQSDVSRRVIITKKREKMGSRQFLLRKEERRKKKEDKMIRFQKEVLSSAKLKFQCQKGVKSAKKMIPPKSGSPHGRIWV